jgi:hypothetical protein
MSSYCPGLILRYVGYCLFHLYEIWPIKVRLLPLSFEGSIVLSGVPPLIAV